MCSSGFANAQADKHLFCQHPMLLFYMRHISITVGKKHVSEEKSTSPYTLIFHYHLNLVLKCCHCIATVLCFVYLAILYCTVLYLYLFICSWAIMALCINKVSYRIVLLQALSRLQSSIYIYSSVHERKKMSSHICYRNTDVVYCLLHSRL